MCVFETRAYSVSSRNLSHWPDELERLPEELAEDIGYRILPGVLSLCDYASATPETATLAARAEKKLLISLLSANDIGPPLLALQNDTTLQLKELVLLDTWSFRFW